MIENDLLYSKEKVNYSTGQDRRIHNSNMPATITNSNIDDRINKFQKQLKNKFLFRIPLKYICNIRKSNFLTKIDLKIRCKLETEMKKLFKTKKSNDIDALDAQIVFLKAYLLQYEQILLTKNFRQYLKTIIISSELLRMGIQ